MQIWSRDLRSHSSTAARRPSSPGSTKSTSMVVPPAAAAKVPDSKVSAAVVPMKGISRCVCGSMPPGMT